MDAYYNRSSPSIRRKILLIETSSRSAKPATDRGDRAVLERLIGVS